MHVGLVFFLVRKKVKPLSNIDIISELGHLPNWRGVFMREALPSKATDEECGVLNLDDKDSKGTHWTCWYVMPYGLRKKKCVCHYFDSYGLPPPREFVKYIRRENPTGELIYNTFQLQNAADGPICGHLCIYVLKNKDCQSFLDILLKMQSRSI